VQVIFISGVIIMEMK